MVSLIKKAEYILDHWHYSQDYRSKEGCHAAVFHKLTGKKRLYPLIAQGEYDAENTYGPVVERFPETKSVQSDEKRHGDMVLALVNEKEKGKGQNHEKTDSRIVTALNRMLDRHSPESDQGMADRQ